MNSFNLFVMNIILSGLALTACDSGNNTYCPNQGRVAAETLFSNENFQLYTFTVAARNWCTLSHTERSVEVSIPSVSEKIINEGSVMLYLSDVGKEIALPFTYYQIRKAVSFQPSYKEKFVYVNVFGSFILNISSPLRFKVLVISGPGLLKFKGLNWYDFEQTKKVVFGDSI
jgi:hypothetical protein